MELIGIGATAFIWIVIILLSGVIGLCATDFLKIKKKEEEQSK